MVPVRGPTQKECKENVKVEELKLNSLVNTLFYVKDTPKGKMS